MNSDIAYKVLWVDDDESIVAGTRLEAEDYELELVHFTNWQDAEVSLRGNFEDYSAVILDANCKIGKDSIEAEEFITAILPSLTSIFSEKGQLLPWYILSAGTMDNFGAIVSGAKYQHSCHEAEWGSLVYLKDVSDHSEQSVSKLFENIQRVARDAPANVVLYRHSDVFAYLGQDKLIKGEARSIMLKMLSALYFPTESKHFEYEGNPLRKVMECIFRAAYRYGLLPQECTERDDQVNLAESNLYMSGLDNNRTNLRYGEKGDTIFPKHIGDITWKIINFGNYGSHTTEKNPYTIDNKNLTIGENEKELYFSCVLQLCYVIRWFGDFVDSHTDVEANKKMIKRAPVSKKATDKEISDSPVGKRAVILSGKSGPYILNCRLPNKFCKYLGKYATIKSVTNNTGKDSQTYPFYATTIDIEK